MDFVFSHTSKVMSLTFFNSCSLIYVSQHLQLHLCLSTFAVVFMSLNICSRIYVSQPLQSQLCLSTFEVLFMSSNLCSLIYVSQPLQSYLCLSTFEVLFVSQYFTSAIRRIRIQRSLESSNYSCLLTS